MKLRIIALATLALGATSAFAHTEEFYGTFSGLNENPQNPSAGTGWARAIVDLDLFTLQVDAQFSGLSGNTTAAHIHAGNGPLTNGGVVTQTPSFTGFPLGVTSGTYSRTFDLTLASSWNATYITANGGTITSAFTAFLGKLRLGHAYFNVHTNAYPGGELRANLNPVPEPATMIALGAGLAGIAARRKRKNAS